MLTVLPGLYQRKKVFGQKEDCELRGQPYGKEVSEEWCDEEGFFRVVGHFWCT